MHKLYLLAEEQTREDTLESIVESIMKNIPQLSHFLIERYNLRNEKILHCKDWYFSDSGCKRYAGSGRYVPDTIHPSIQPLIQELKPLPPVDHWYPYSESERILNPDIDVLEVYGKDRKGIFRSRCYYNIGGFFANTRKDSLTLITTHHRWFLVEKNSDKDWSVELFENWNEGQWIKNYNLGIISIAKRPTHGNNVVALHEIGHHFTIPSFRHHSDPRSCVMRDIWGRGVTPKTPEQFCEDCKKLIQRYF